MTDRFNALTVVLERDTRDDDSESLINAIMNMRGVVSVTGNVVTTDSYVAEQRARHAVVEKLLDLIKQMNR